MSSSSQTKLIGCGPCFCACYKSEIVINNDTKAVPSSTDADGTSRRDNENVAPNAFARPSMMHLHRMLQNKEWEGIQDAIRKDASVSMRINDSPEEDRWFDEARRRKAVMEGFVLKDAPLVHDEGVTNSSKGPGVLNSKDGDSPIRLRYWVGNNQGGDNNRSSFATNNDGSSIFSDDDAENHMRATLDIQQKRTLLHSLCRMYFPSNEALVVQLKHGDSEGLRNLCGAVKTAQMLIEASHNNLMSINIGGEGDKRSISSPHGVEVDKNAMNDDCSPNCKNCPCCFYRHYCPPVPSPPVERQQTDRSENEEDSQHADQSIDPEQECQMIQHTSVLTMTDAMGETPLHALTGAGSCHADLIQVFLKACRSSEDPCSEDERRPTIHNIVVAQNYHGCTPLHFLADSKNEEVIHSVLRQCPPTANMVHPTMVRDNEGDLPLHFAACNGGPPSLLHSLTSADARPSIVRNFQGRLAIDDLIVWFIDSLDDHMNGHIPEEDDSSEVDSDSDSDSDSDGSDSSSVLSNSQSMEESREFRNNNNDARDSKCELSCHFLSSETNWEVALWDPMWVLIQAAATAVGYSLSNGTGKSGEAQLDLNPLFSTHAAVIATKYANFPALTLMASLLQNKNGNDKGLDAALLEEDSYGYLPLHWACGGKVPFLHSDPTSNYDSKQSCHNNISILTELNKANDGPLNPSTSQCKELSRWNTHGLCSMIKYLLHREPSAARIPTRQGRLPIHLLAEDYTSFHPLILFQRDQKTIDFDADEVSNQQWENIKAILKEHPESLGIPDPISRLYPFQLAAVATLNASSCNPTQTDTKQQSEQNVSLTNTYRLMMEDPSLLCQLIETN